LLGGNLKGLLSYKIVIKHKGLRPSQYSEEQEKLLNLINNYRTFECKTYKEISDLLNQKNYKTFKGHSFIPESVFSIFKKGNLRMNKLENSMVVEIIDLKIIENT
jgi:hypothetical protein